MDKKTRELAIAVVLVLIFLVSLTKNVILRRPPAAPRPADEAAASVAPANLSFLIDVRRNEDLLARQGAAWEKDWGRDPFLAKLEEPEAAGSRVGDLELTGIVWDEKMPYAMVSGKVMKVGDSLEGHMVVEIRQSSIVLYSDDGQFVELHLFEVTAPEAAGT